MFEQTWLPEIVFFVLGSIITAVVLLLQRQTKTLDWELVADQPIVGAMAEYIGSSLTVEWEGTKLEQPRVINLRIFNSGKREVLGSELQGPIGIVVPNAKIVAAYVTGSTPGAYSKGAVPIDRNVSIEYGDVVKLKPEFLNRDDYLAVQVIVDGQEGRAEVASRFAGQSRDMRNVVGRELNRGGWSMLVCLLAFTAAIATAAVTVTPTDAWTQNSITELPRFALLLMLLFLVTAISAWTVSAYSQIRFLKRQYGMTTVRTVRATLFPPTPVRKLKRRTKLSSE